ncbi:MAG: hypothetical protein JXR49_11940 [Acidobacteria bacterium]|nr:hypothetical protein [Acidobacteriota bacterium]
MSTGALFNKDQNNRNPVIGQAGSILSLDPQFRSLRLYIEDGRTTLDQLRADFSVSQSNPGDSSRLQRAAKKLAGFCADTDGWGFERLYRVAFGLQALLVNSLNRSHNDIFWEVLRQALAMLAALLNQCESEYRLRLAVDDLLDSFDRAACN